MYARTNKEGTKMSNAELLACNVLGVRELALIAVGYFKRGSKCGIDTLGLQLGILFQRTPTERRHKIRYGTLSTDEHRSVEEACRRISPRGPSKFCSRSTDGLPSMVLSLPFSEFHPVFSSAVRIPANRPIQSVLKSLRHD